MLHLYINVAFLPSFGQRFLDDHNCDGSSYDTRMLISENSLIDLGRRSTQPNSTCVNPKRQARVSTVELPRSAITAGLVVLASTKLQSIGEHQRRHTASGQLCRLRPSGSACRWKVYRVYSKVGDTTILSITTTRFRNCPTAGVC